jgi:hypothetical protein
MESKQEELRACLVEAEIVKEELLKDLITEANELVAIFAASYRTAHR